MVSLLKKIFRNLWRFRSLPTTIWFNFHYLPLKQAVKLPIILYKPTLLKCRGHIKIEAEKIRFGMIYLGKFNCSLYPNTGFTYENNGGTVVFKGEALIGNASFLSVGQNGFISFGHKFEQNAGIKIACHKKIIFDDFVSLGWDCMVLDSDFHQLSLEPSKQKKCDQKEFSPVSGEIHIGRNCWIATKCLVLKNTILPDNCTVASNSLLCKAYNVPSYTMLAGQPAVPKKTGVFRDRENEYRSN